MFTQNIFVTEKTFRMMEKSAVSTSHTNMEIDFASIVQKACEKVAPSWPLTNFIAVNPLKGYESLPFEKAATLAERYFHGRAFPNLEYFHKQFRQGRITLEDLRKTLASETESVRENALQALIQEASNIEEESANELLNERVFLLPSECFDQRLGTRLYSWAHKELTKWCASYFDLGQASWPMPDKSEGFYSTWKRLAESDRSFELAGVTGFRKLVASLPDCPLKAIEKLCLRIEIPNELLSDYFARHFAAMPGWSGLFAYTGDEKKFFEGQEKYKSLVDWLAVRIAYDVAGAEWASKQLLRIEPKWRLFIEELRKGLPQTQQTKKDEATLNVALTWLKAFERNYRSKLNNLLTNQLRNSEPKVNLPRPRAQAVFCIDVRSEGMRRHLEKQGNYETFGFAGFFAVPLAFQEIASDEISAQCPVLLRPKYLVTEKLVSGEEQTLKQKKLTSDQLKEVLKEVKTTSISPFSFVETFGGFNSAILFARSFIPKQIDQLATKVRKVLKLNEAKTLVLNTDSASNPLYTCGIPLQDQVAIAENSLRFMGLTEQFSRIVLLCGHGSETQNNPYASALDCGACGGHRGAPNARVAAAIFNSTQVRNELHKRGITIPHDTWFVAGEHNTTNDKIKIIDEFLVPLTHRKDLSDFISDLKQAGEALNVERTQRFDRAYQDNTQAVKEVERRSHDWSETRPEWGLAGNAAFIIARRSLTKDLDLQCRTFLHSYKWESDPESKALEVIMTAPMIVTQWINSQYYFSSVDPSTFGSGNKTIHNMVGKIGVMEGNVSDLKIGLPIQSVSDGETLQHEPMRLNVYIEAPLEKIRAIAEKHDSVRQLVTNEWIRIIGMDSREAEFKALSKTLEWETEA